MTHSHDAAVARSPLERELRAVGAQLAESFPSRVRHPVRALDDKAIARSSEDAELRAALFRLVDVTPACRALDDLARHLPAYLESGEERPPPLRAAMRAAGTRAGRTALGAAAAAGVRHMAHRFIVAEAPEATVGELRRMWRDGIAASVDLLGEATVSGPEADRYAARCEHAVGVLTRGYSDVPERPVLEQDSIGALPRANLSVKVTALTPMLRPSAPQRGRADAAARLRPLLRRAHAHDCHIHVDMESVDSLETTLELVFELLAEEEFREGPSVGVVVQAYLRDSPRTLERVLEYAAATPRSAPLVVRLVKGAYWDHERVEALQHGWRPPVFECKADSDRNFEALTRRLLDARPSVRVAVASHNLRSLAHAIACNRASGGEDRDLELQVLRGLGDELAHALAANGFRVRSYCPVGDLVSGMAYLVRRLLENTANESFLHDSARGVPLERRLAAP